MKRKLFESKDNKKSDEPKTKKQKTEVIIYWERIYRYVEKYERLYGDDVHVSKGELGLPDAEEYKLVPFSHMSELGALFELQAIDDDMLSIACKDYQRGTGVAAFLTEEIAPITRIFYDPSSIDKTLEKQIIQLSQEKKIELVQIDHLNLMTEHTKDIKLRHISKTEPNETKSSGKKY